MSAAGWIALIATNSSVCTNFVTGIVGLPYPDVTIERWQSFLMYCAWTLVAFVLNMFCIRALPLLERGAFIWSIVGFFVVIIAVLVCARGEYQPAKAVFATWTNQTGVSAATRLR